MEANVVATENSGCDARKNMLARVRLHTAETHGEIHHAVYFFSFGRFFHIVPDQAAFFFDVEHFDTVDSTFIGTLAAPFGEKGGFI